MASGAIALERLQAGLETVRGTPVAATRRVYGERGNMWWDPTVTKEYMNESMSSYVKTYRHLVTGVSGQLTVPGWLSAADFAWWGQLFFKGGVTGALSALTAYTYTFTPTIGSDDLKTATFEAFSDVTGYQFPFCLADKLEISWAVGKAAQFTATLMGQQFIAQAVTGAIGDRTGINLMSGTNANVFIDAAGGTIGTTPYANVMGGKVTWQNNWMPITHNKGQLFYDDAVREPRSVSIELDCHYKDNVELGNLSTDAERLIQMEFVGPVIAGSTGSLTEDIKVNFYGFHTDAAFSVNKAIRMVKLVGESQYDANAGVDWNVVVRNALVTLP